MLDGDYLDFRRRNPQGVRPRPNPSDWASAHSTQSGSRTTNVTANTENNRSNPPTISQSGETTADESRSGLDVPEYRTIGNSGILFPGFYNPNSCDQGYQIDPDNAPFPDLWQMPHMDVYTQF